MMHRMILLIGIGISIVSASVDVEILGKEKARVFKAIKYDFLQKTNNHFGNSGDKRTKVIRFFEADLKKLIADTSDPEEQAKLEAISAHWTKLKKLFDTPVTDATIEKIFKEEFHEGLRTKKKILELTQTQLKDDKNKTLFYLNNLRAISQKFAITYLVKTVEPTGATSEETQKQLAITLEKFRTALDHLHKELKTEEQKAMLQELEKIYLYFDFLSQSRQFTPTLIIHKSDEMLTLAKKLVKSYHAN